MRIKIKKIDRKLNMLILKWKNQNYKLCNRPKLHSTFFCLLNDLFWQNENAVFSVLRLWATLLEKKEGKGRPEILDNCTNCLIIKQRAMFLFLFRKKK